MFRLQDILTMTQFLMLIIERAKRAHSLVMTFEIFHIMFVRTSSVHYLEYRTAHVLSAQNKRTEAERETGTACGRNQV